MRTEVSHRRFPECGCFISLQSPSDPKPDLPNRRPRTEGSEARGGVACWKEELSFGVTRFFRAVRSCPLIVGRKRSSGDSIVGDH